MGSTLQVFAASLHERYAYCPATGEVTRRVRCGNFPAGSVCQSITTNKKYLKVENYLLHRLAWFLHTGEQPPEQVDHEDLDGFNNRWSNLRAADFSQNQCNIEVHTRSQTGIKGIMPVRGGKLYRAEVCINGVRHQKHSKNIETLQQWVIDKRNELHQTYARN